MILNEGSLKGWGIGPFKGWGVEPFTGWGVGLFGLAAIFCGV